MTQEELAIASSILVALDRVASALETLSQDFAYVHKLRIDTCPACKQKRDPEKGFIIHLSGCLEGWGETPLDEI